MELEHPNELSLDLALAVRRAYNGYLVIEFKVADFQDAQRTTNFGLDRDKNRRFDAVFAVDSQCRTINFNNWSKDAMTAHKIFGGGEADGGASRP